jgi:helicase MOV-10
LAGRGPVTRKKPRAVVVVFMPADAGYYEDTLELVFAQRSNPFIITRRVYGTAGSPEDQEELKPRAPYKKKKWTPLRIDGPVILSPRPAVWSPIKWANFLPKFDPPQVLINAAFQPNSAEALRAFKRLMPTVLNINTYGDWFQKLLHIEGEQRK